MHAVTVAVAAVCLLATSAQAQADWSFASAAGGSYTKKSHWETPSESLAPETGDSVSIVGIAKAVKVGKGTELLFAELLVDGGSDLRLVKSKLLTESGATITVGRDDASGGVSKVRGSIKSSSHEATTLQVGVGEAASGAVELSAGGGLALESLVVAKPEPSSVATAANVVTGRVHLKGDVSTTSNVDIAFVFNSANDGRTIASAVGDVEIDGDLTVFGTSQVSVGFARSAGACASSAKGTFKVNGNLVSGDDTTFSLEVGRSRGGLDCEDLQTEGLVVVKGDLKNLFTGIVASAFQGPVQLSSPVKGSLKVLGDLETSEDGGLEVGHIAQHVGAANGELVVGGDVALNSMKVGISTVTGSDVTGSATIGGHLFPKFFDGGEDSPSIVLGASNNGGTGFLAVSGDVTGFHAEVDAGALELGKASSATLRSLTLGAAGELRLNVLKPTVAASVVVQGEFTYGNGATIVIVLDKKLAKKKFVNLPLLSANDILSPNPANLVNVKLEFKGKTYAFPEGVPLAGDAEFNASLKVGPLSSKVNLAFDPVTHALTVSFKR